MSHLEASARAGPTLVEAEREQADLEELKEPTSGGEELGTDAVERFRNLREAAARQDKRRSNEKMVDATLKTLDLALTKEQRSKLVDALEAYEPRRLELWQAVKTQAATQGGSVDWPQVIEATNGVVRREFADRVSQFLPVGDAQSIAETLGRAGMK